ncbi:MAG: heme ABC transporter permease [Chromatiales bacterium]|jgi:heme exporter protein C|nr:heme ABC transporter permease [Chromatiales bacterium]MDP6149930.1 heme ABC transporter permease [Gammaproteobacteria bacterium]MDP7271703.1 heme ABC transporter permease [Gammaproteobacteria bacterium]HJP03830.1 heme ABC transporter permease [Gammaproteobacteria bacterium]
MWNWFYKLASPPHFYRTATVLEPWLFWPALVLLAIGLYGGLVMAPADYVQGDGYRIIYVHVPSSYLSMFTYVTMAVTSAIGLIWRMKLAFCVAAACAPIGAAFTFMSLTTGAIWGQPMWGTWWVWDPRLTSQLILFFLYLGYMFLRQALAETRQADRASGVLAVVGVVNIPIIHFSVEWWNSLHQPASLSKLETPAIAGDMLWPLLVMILAYQLLMLALLMTGIRAQVLEREKNARWVGELLDTTGHEA